MSTVATLVKNIIVKITNPFLQWHAILLRNTECWGARRHLVANV